MISLLISLAVLLLGYFFYGRFTERIFSPDDRRTPAVKKTRSVMDDYSFLWYII